jgi:hypothetical protein
MMLRLCDIMCTIWNNEWSPGNIMLVATEEQRNIRKAEIHQEDIDLQKVHEEARKNRGFTQTYPQGWKRIRELAKGNPGAVSLYAFFSEHIDPSCGAVLADQQFLAEQMGVSRSSISRWLAYLEKEQAVIRIPVAGRVCAYALNPHEVWKGYDANKEYAAFVTKTLVNKDGNIERRIKAMFGS